MNTETRHAALPDAGPYLCRAATYSELGRRTKPGETVNCPACRTMLNALRERYPVQWDYQDKRLTKAEAKAAAADMRRDMYDHE